MSKRNKALFVVAILFLLTPGGVFAQKQYLDTIEVCSSLNTYLKIKGIEIKTINIAGSNNVNYQNVAGVIMFKAARENFESTNMLVIAPDTIFQFYLRYNPHPKKSLYQYSLGKSAAKAASGQTEAPALTSKEVSPGEEAPVASKPEYNASSFNALKLAKSNINVGLIKDRIMYRLPLIAQDKKNMYFLIKIKNNSTINYLIDNINFEVRSRKTVHTSGQQAVYPEYTESPENVSAVGAKKEVILMYALNKFALRSDELLTVTLFEKSSSSKGRQFKIDVSSSDYNSVITLN